MSPTPRTAGLAAIVALSALVVPPLLSALGGLALLAAVAVDLLAARRRAAVTRRAPSSLSRGVPEPLRLELRAGRGRSLRFRQATSADLELTPDEGSGSTEALLTARRRGKHRLPPLAVRVTGPLGLVSRYSDEAGESELTVYPDLPAARRLVVSVRQGRLRSEGYRARGPIGLGTEFERVRDYSPDDDVRQINWLASARLGRPMSNEHRLEQDRDVIAMIDCGRLMRAPAGGGSGLDATLDAAVALAAVCDELGDRFGAIAFDAGVVRRLRPRRGGGALALPALYDLEPSELDSDYLGAFGAVEAGKRSLVVVLTDLVEEIAARPLVEAVPVLTRRHAVTVAALADPGLELAVALPPSGALGAYRSSAAVEVMDARARAEARIRAAGADVVSAPPGRLAGAAVGSYLRAKSRARI